MFFDLIKLRRSVTSIKSKNTLFSPQTQTPNFTKLNENCNPNQLHYRSIESFENKSHSNTFLEKKRKAIFKTKKTALEAKMNNSNPSYENKLSLLSKISTEEYLLKHHESFKRCKTKLL